MTIGALIEDTDENRRTLAELLNDGLFGLRRVCCHLRPGEIETTLNGKTIEGTRKMRLEE